MYILFTCMHVLCARACRELCCMVWTCDATRHHGQQLRRLCGVGGVGGGQHSAVAVIFCSAGVLWVVKNAGNVKYSKCVEIEYGQPLVKTRIPSWKDSQRICNNEQSISFSKSFAAPGCRLVARASIMSTRCSGRAAQSDQAIIFHQSLDWLEWKMMQILWIFLLLSWYFWMFQCLMPNLLR